MNPIRLTEIAYSSEWFLAKLYPALKHDEIKDLFQLVSVGGRQKDVQSVLERIAEIKKLKEKEKAEESNYAKRNNSAETQSLDSIETRLRENTLDYFPFESHGEEVVLPTKMFENSDAIYICTTNVTHPGTISEAIKAKKPILCEKPVCIVLGKDGIADNNQLSRLENIAQTLYSDAIIIDAEHYSYKPSSMNFYRNIEKILNGREVVEIRGEIIEHDSPAKDRVVKLLSQESRTGLLTDTGVHLLSFASNLGYRATPIKAEHGMFHGKCQESDKEIRYNTETATKATYELNADTETPNRYIRNGTMFYLTVEKFGQYSGMTKSKKLNLNLSDGSTLTINFDDKNGNLSETRDSPDGLVGTIITHPLTPGINSSEYVNILKEFERTIRNPNQRALTDFKNSLRTMKAIYETYIKAPIIDQNNITLKYGNN